MLYRPPRSELYTVIYQREINNYLMPKLKSLGANFLGMAERTPYGDMFVSTDVEMAKLMYEAKWYNEDTSLQRNKNKSKILIPHNFKDGDINREILNSKRYKANQIGNFTIPIKIGDTEIFATISSDTLPRLLELRNENINKLKLLVLDFRTFMHKLSNERSFSESRSIREQRRYFISGKSRLAVNSYCYNKLDIENKYQFMDAYITLPEKADTIYLCSNIKKNDIKVVCTPMERFDLFNCGYKTSKVNIMYECEEDYFD
jgi:hypothetical protein